MRTMLEARLYGTPLLVFETGMGELAQSEQIDAAPDAWKLTGAWRREQSLDGTDIERWLRGLRPQYGAREAQTVRARETLRERAIRRSVPDQGDIVWATPHMEYPGAVQFRSFTDDDRTIVPEPQPEGPLDTDDLERLLDQVIEEMRHGTIHHRRPGAPSISPSGSLPKCALHRHPVTGEWHRPHAGRLSTHIIKLEDRASVPAEAAVESVCQRALRELGVRAARTWTQLLGRRQIVVSERSDRTTDAATGSVTPIHQEEWGCACGRDPDELVQRPGTGGGWVALHDFLTERSAVPTLEQEHFWTVLAALVLLGHRDLHRRNVGIRYGRADEEVRAELAPLYDVSSMDGQQDNRWRSLGLPVGGESEIDRIGESAWVRVAEQCRASPDDVLGIVAETARRLPDAVETATRKARDEDEWRDRHSALQRLEALKKGTARRAEKALRPTLHARKPRHDPQWSDDLIEAVKERKQIVLEPNEAGTNLKIVVVEDNGTRNTIGIADHCEAYCRALARGRVIAPEDAPYLERTLERRRQLELTRMRARGKGG